MKRNVQNEIICSMHTLVQSFSKMAEYSFCEVGFSQAIQTLALQRLD